MKRLLLAATALVLLVPAAQATPTIQEAAPTLVLTLTIDRVCGGLTNEYRYALLNAMASIPEPELYRLSREVGEYVARIGTIAFCTESKRFMAGASKP
jgi:hypothetical protein